jgi:hypothetical protein
VIDGDKGDITVSNDGIAWTINEESVGNAELANMAGQTIKARVQSDAGEPQDATASEIRTLLNVEDGAQANVLPDWIAESGSARILNKPVLGGAAALGVGTTAGTVAAGDDARLSDSREWNAATIEQAEAEAGTGTTRRAFTAQRVFQAIAAWWAASSAKTKLDGIETGAQVNVATNLTYDAPTREVRSSTGTDAVLPLVSTSSAGLVPETGTPSGKYLKDDGTWATVEAGASPAGSGTEIQYRNSSALGAIPNSSVDGATGAVTLARLIAAANGAASTPPMALTGTWFTGGTGTTTKPAFLLEPAGTTSTAWSTSGTGLGVNAPSGFAGNLLDLQVNGTTRASITSAGTLFLPQTGFVNQVINWGNSNGIRQNSNSSWGFLAGNAQQLSISTITFGVVVNSESFLGFGSPSSPTSTSRFYLDAAHALALRNDTNAQTFRVYNTFTSATNFERAKIEWASNILRIGTEKGADGGTARDMELQTDDTTRITVKADGAILFSGIPTSNPNVAGQLWNDGGTLKISAG